jgi:hypothetical protein
MKVVINKCFGGFGLSDAAYEKLIEWGIPVRGYIKQKRNPKTMLYRPEPANDGEIIFDRTLTPNDELNNAEHIKFLGRYWDTWTSSSRTHPLLVKVVEELGGGHRTGASDNFANLVVVEIPDGIEYTIEEYAGREHIAEVHKTWG